MNQGISADYYGFPGSPQYVEDYPLYPPGVRPDSICSVSAVGGYDRRWTVEEKRRSLRDGPHQLYGHPVPRDLWGTQFCGGMETSMRRLSIQPRSRSVPRSPSSSSGGPYSPVPPHYASPARSPSARFDRFSGRMRDEVIYADPSVYSLRRSLSSPKVILWVFVCCRWCTLCMFLERKTFIHSCLLSTNHFSCCTLNFFSMTTLVTGGP